METRHLRGHVTHGCRHSPPPHQDPDSVLTSILAQPRPFRSHPYGVTKRADPAPYHGWLMPRHSRGSSQTRRSGGLERAPTFTKDFSPRSMSSPLNGATSRVLKQSRRTLRPLTVSDIEMGAAASPPLRSIPFHPSSRIADNVIPNIFQMRIVTDQRVEI